MQVIKSLAIVTFLLSGCGSPGVASLAEIRHGGGPSSDDGASHDQGDDHGGRRGGGTDDSSSDQRRGGAESRGRAARIVTPGTQTIALGASFALTLEKAREGDDDVYVFSATGLPTGLTIDSASGEIAGVVGGSAGTFDVTVSFVEANELPGHRPRTVSFQIVVTADTDGQG